MAEKVLRAKDLLKTTEIIECTPQATLKEALAKLSRSHDAVFVFAAKRKFLGVINPYYTIFKSNYPPDTKVETCLYIPPHLSLNSYIWDIAKLMIESKIYYLPVFQNKHKFLGIVSVRRVLQAISADASLANQLKVQTKKEVVTITNSASLTETYSRMRDKQVSRLPVVNGQNCLIGIVTRFDIRAALAEPQQKPRWLSRMGEKEKYLDQPIEGYVKKLVVTASPQTTGREMLNKILAENVGSIVVVDTKRRPVGIVSTHDLLQAVARLRPQRSKNIGLTLDEGFIHRVRLEDMLVHFVGKMDKFNPIRHVQLVLEGQKNPAGKVKRYASQLQVVLKNGQRVVAKATEYDWKKAVGDTLEKVRRQLPS